MSPLVVIPVSIPLYVSFSIMYGNKDWWMFGPFVNIGSLPPKFTVSILFFADSKVHQGDSCCPVSRTAVVQLI